MNTGPARNLTTIIGEKVADHRKLAALIEASEEFTEQNIRLLSCETGDISNGIAQNLANKLGVPVSAPTDVDLDSQPTYGR